MSTNLEITTNLRGKRKNALTLLLIGYIYLLFALVGMFLSNLIVGISGRTANATEIANSTQNMAAPMPLTVAQILSAIDIFLVTTSIVIGIVIVAALVLIFLVSAWIKQGKGNSVNVYKKGFVEGIVFTVLAIGVILVLLFPLGLGASSLFRNVGGAIVTFLNSLLALLFISIGWITLAINVKIVKETFTFQSTYQYDRDYVQNNNKKIVVKKPGPKPSDKKTTSVTKKKSSSGTNSKKDLFQK